MIARYAHYPAGDNVMLNPVSLKKSRLDEGEDSTSIGVHRNTGAIYGVCAIVENSLIRAMC
eukprot:8133343-Prorocentrum_lima.AAC.1